jgi:hypothetical protein
VLDTRLISLDDAAALCGVSRRSLERHVLPMIASRKIGRRRLVDRESLERYLEQSIATGQDELEATRTDAGAYSAASGLEALAEQLGADPPADPPTPLMSASADACGRVESH